MNLTLAERRERIMDDFGRGLPGPGLFGIMVQSTDSLSGCLRGQCWYHSPAELLTGVFEHLPAFECHDEDELHERLEGLAPLRPKEASEAVLSHELLKQLEPYVVDQLHWWGPFEDLLSSQAEFVRELRQDFWEQRAEEQGPDDWEPSTEGIPPKLLAEFVDFLSYWSAG